MAAKYKDPLGRFLTQSLFFERCVSNMKDDEGKDWVPPFTLKEHDHIHEGIHYRSMRQIYLSYSDPTEYSFAIDTLGSWDHWQRLCETSWLKPYIESWRAEMEISLRSKATSSLIQAAADPIKGVQAAKWLAEGGFKGKRRAGAPSKEEVEREKKIQAAIKENTEDDAKRLGLLN